MWNKLRQAVSKNNAKNVGSKDHCSAILRGSKYAKSKVTGQSLFEMLEISLRNGDQSAEVCNHAK